MLWIEEKKKKKHKVGIRRITLRKTMLKLRSEFRWEKNVTVTIRSKIIKNETYY